MRFQIGNDGTELTGRKWAWVSLESGLHVEVFQPTNTEHLKALTRFGVIRGNPDWKGFALFLAREWFRDFKGAMADDGVTPLPNTEKVRLLMLEDPTVNLLDSILPLFKSAAEDDAEGKGGSASA